MVAADFFLRTLPEPPDLGGLLLLAPAQVGQEAADRNQLRL